MSQKADKDGYFTEVDDGEQFKIRKNLGMKPAKDKKKEG